MEFLRRNLKVIIITLVLVAGVVVTVVLVQRQVLFKSKASADPFAVTVPDGTTVNYEGPGNFSTTADSVNVEIQDLNGLK